MIQLIIVQYAHCTCKIEAVSNYLNMVALTELMMHRKIELEPGALIYGMTYDIYKYT